MAGPNNSTISPPSLEQTSFETSFYNKVYAITGGSSGIGLSTARILARYGARVSICARNRERLSKAVSELTTLSPWGADGVLSQAVDVSLESEVDSFIAATVEKFGQLDGAVNSAAVEGSYTTPLEKVDTALWNSVIAANLTGTMFSVRAEIRSMKSGGSIVNVASILSKIAMAGNAPYVASKHGVIGLTKAVAKEMGPKGIRVNALSPGYCNTGMAEAVMKEPGIVVPEPDHLAIARRSDPIEQARPILFLLSSYSSYVTGENWSVDGGWAI